MEEAATAAGATKREEDASGSTLVNETPTRRLARQSLRSAATTVGSNTSLKATTDALLADEMGRMRVTAKVLMLVAGMGTLVVPFFQGQQLARQVMTLALAASFASLAQIYRVAGSTQRYDVRQVGALSLVLATALNAAVNFFGVFSPGAMMGSLGLYIFCLGSSTGWSAAMFAVIAGGHTLMASTILLGLRTDPGLITADRLTVPERVAIVVCMLFVYVVAFGAGRAARHKLVLAVEDMEAAVRKLTERDAQLHEARREFERAAWVGGEGRFTQHQIGSFMLGNIIGRGGMGEVYEAEHVETGQEAAVKLLHRGAFGDPSSVARFAREARAAASLDSEHVVRVLEVPDDDSPIPYLA